MTSDPDQRSEWDARRPWPRFTQRPASTLPHAPGPYEPWPRWGWFPREQRSWTFAPAPNLAAPELVAPPPPLELPSPAATDGPGEAEAPRGTAEEAAATAVTEVTTEPEPSPVRATLPPEGRAEVAEPELLPVRRSPSLALVPVRSGEVTLSEVARAVRKVAPAAAVVGAAAAAAMALFRRR
ncbi:MAG: hypothetical protein KC472_03990 [Dehalococcoidia bacterium]|nr:hypothetical protein [Dehalococcoidia bacterium]